MMEFKELNMEVFKSILNAYPYEVIFVTVRDDEGKVIGYFERHEMHWDFSDPGKPVAVPKLEAGY